MSLSFEALLIIGIAGFYLFDSATLLYADELVYIKQGKGWAFACPRGNWRLGGKTLYIPNPLTPVHPLFRVHWSPAEPQPPCESTVPVDFLNALRPFCYLNGLLLVLLLGIQPLILLTLGAGVEFLAVLAIIYSIVLAMVILSYRRRLILDLSRKVWMKLTFDSLICIPYALNFTRKLTLSHPLTQTPVNFALQHFDTTTLSQLGDTLHTQIDEELAFEDENSLRYKALLHYKSRIANLIPDQTTAPQ